MTSPLRYYYAILAFLTWNVVANPVTSPVVDLGYAKYAGSFNATRGTTQFLGMRYAAPPTGTLRWQPPHPPATTPGIQTADSEPSVCFFAGQGNQAASPFRDNKNHKKRDLSFTEDCLFLNVYLPGQLSSTEKLPVVVWIHGGGYMSGSASGFNGADFYDGNALISEANGGVVVVVIQYRLGLFGFLAGKEVKKDGTLNVGLLDQQFALRWVQNNIHKFNGDPSRVAIWGQSAGAGSVMQHVVANGGKTSPPLFRAAITSSTFLPSQYSYDDRIPETLYNEVVAQTNCSTALNTLDCLRSVDAQILETANGNIGNSGFFGVFLFVPVVDGELIKERVTKALEQKRINGDIVLAATNSFEGTLFIDPKTPVDVDVANYVAQLFPDYSDKQIAAAAALYKDLGTPLFQVTAIMGESIFICPTYFMLEAFGGRGFKTEFAIPPGGHGNDVAYYYPSNGPPLFNNPDFIKAFSHSFLDFAISLNPNEKSSPTITPNWGLWEGKNEMLFNMTEGGLPDVRAIETSSALLRRCE
ncbi:hypothetical protein H2248_008731 [Termitomyces sp. 'cryptogamus']|nr:hypothetical protein H2248_008731 [Termitomyces sp. 'cryptogamus']